ncbi:ankyrin repeat domain protein [Nitzschia inconspicua]|uniref:Ankyrin repeat domain protein n=1 Tax=Nitzschia inconspicua TaxID=303405 RepID=A0A9K3M4Q2_9STRA|nr:ankyrin repeat domain protein [Nitzschia inconspicua]
MPSANACGSCYQDNFSFALYNRFRTPKLYRLATNGEWDQIPARCKNHPKEAQFIHKYAPMDTALHRILRTESCQTCPPEMKQNIYEMKLDAVKALLEANPVQASTADTFQRTPLHWACMDAESNDVQTGGDDDEHGDHISESTLGSGSVLLELLDHAPQAVKKVDIERRIPLHYLLARNDEIPLRLLAKMVALYPDSLTVKDEVGETPLDILQSRKEEIPNMEEVIKTLLKLKSMLASTAQVILEKHSHQPEAGCELAS